MADKTPEKIINSWKDDFANRVSKNPSYSKMAQYARGDDQDITDDYFYAFKDAYEKSKLYNRYGYMSEDEVRDNLDDAYYGLMDNYQNNHGLYGREWEQTGIPMFEREHGTLNEFSDKGINGWRKWMQENYGGYSEDHQNFGYPIRQNPEKFKTLDDLKRWHREYAPSGYDELLEFWTNKLGFGGK